MDIFWIGFTFCCHRFENGMVVTVNNAPWRNPPITIVEVTHSKNKFTAAPKRSDVAGMHLTQAQRTRAFEEFKKLVAICFFLLCFWFCFFSILINQLRV